MGFSCISGPRLRSQGKEIWVASSSLPGSEDGRKFRDTKKTRKVRGGETTHSENLFISCRRLFISYTFLSTPKGLLEVNNLQRGLVGVVSQGDNCLHWFIKCHEQPSMKSYLLLVLARMYFGNIQSHTVFPLWNWPWNLFSKSARRCKFQKNFWSYQNSNSCLLKNAKPRQVFLEESTFFSRMKPLTFDYFPANVSSFSCSAFLPELVRILCQRHKNRLTKLTKTPLEIAFSNRNILFSGAMLVFVAVCGYVWFTCIDGSNLIWPSGWGDITKEYTYVYIYVFKE